MSAPPRVTKTGWVQLYRGPHGWVQTTGVVFDSEEEATRRADYWGPDFISVVKVTWEDFR